MTNQQNVPEAIFNQPIGPSLQDQIDRLLLRITALEAAQVRQYPPVRFPYEQAQGWQGQAQAQGDWSQYGQGQLYDNMNASNQLESREWNDWMTNPPPRDEIVECRRLTGDEPDFSFWVKPELMSPFWNIWGIYWKKAK